MTRDYVRKVMVWRHAYGVMMVALGDVDGMVSGLTMSYAEITNGLDEGEEILLVEPAALAAKSS